MVHSGINLAIYLAKMGKQNVTAHHFEVFTGRNHFQPTPVVEGIVPLEGTDRCAFGQKHFSQMGADKAVRTGDKNPAFSHFCHKTNLVLSTKGRNPKGYLALNSCSITNDQAFAYAALECSRIAPDVIAQNAEITWQDIPKGWYIPLDEFLERPNPYIKDNTRWMDSFLNLALVNAKRAPNGKLYCLSMDIVETAIFYNKDLFKKYNLRVPKTWQEFMLLQEKLAAPYITPVGVLTKSGGQLGTGCYF